MVGELLVAAGMAARSLASPDPMNGPPRDGCARDRGAIFTHQVPNWVYVFDGSEPATSAPPPQRWAHGIAHAEFEPELAAHPTGIDDPLTHTSYDFVFN